MHALILSGVLASLLMTLPLAWKWQLGVGRVAAVVTALGLAACAAVALLAAFVPLGPWLQAGLVWAATVAVALSLLAYRFYRDPERIPPESPDVVVSPADGRVVYVRASQGGMLPVSTKRGTGYPLTELTRTTLHAGEAVVVGISMSFLDVHVNRSPIGGDVAFGSHFPGRFGSLRNPEMVFRNERATTVIERPGLQVAVVQIASRLVRRIVVFLKEGQHVGLGQRLGAIRFGSQVDVVLPSRSNLKVTVREGDILRAGESVIAVVQHSRSRRIGARTAPAGALIVGGDYRGVCIARSLGRHGVSVRLLAERGDSLASVSRYAGRVLHWPSDETRQLELLIELADHDGLGGWAVFPTGDRTAGFLARHHSRLGQAYALTTPDWEIMRWALDKRLTHELADRMRVERPLTWYPASSADLACIDAAFPVILKPSVKDNENGFTRAKAWRVENRRELGRRYEEACRLVPRDHIMVQELIPGGGEAQFSFAALCSEGEVLSSLTARRTRQYPVEFGHSSSFVETVDRPEVAEAARRLLTDIRYSGLIEVEFKYDSRTGAFKLLDMNPRIWTWSAIGRKAGVDFPYLMWRHLCNEPIAELAGRAGVRWVRMSTDVLAAWPRILAGKLSLASYMGTFRGPLQFALASADDPVPALISLPYRMTAAAMRFLFRGARNDTNPPAAARLVEPRTRRNTAPHVVPGAVVLGGDYQGLGIVRSLGRHGIPVCVIDNEPSISRYSRYTTHWVRAPDLFDATRTVESVLDAGRRFGLQGWVLYPTRDEIVAAFSRYRGDLEKVFRVPTPGWETVRVAWDKRLTYRLAENLGIATPRTQFARDVAELALREVEFPVVLKPAIKEHFIYATKLKAIRADNRNELACLFRRACEVIPAEEVMLQELIPGGGECQYSYCALFKDGRPLAKMVVRRVRQHPPDFGRASTFVRTEDIGEIEEPSERFLAACGYYGLVEVEYKYDARDGRFKLLDVNPRTWGYHSIGTRAGVDFPYLLFRDQLGLQVEECRAETGIRWIRLMTDVPTSLAEMLRGRMTLGAFTRSLTSFDTEAVFAKDDMRPALADVAALPYLYRTRQAKDWGRGSS